MNRDKVLKPRSIMGMLIIIAMIFQYVRIASLPIGLMNGTPGVIALPYLIMVGLLIPLMFTLLVSIPALLIIELNQWVIVPSGFRLPIRRIIQEPRLKRIEPILKRRHNTVMRC